VAIPTVLGLLQAACAIPARAEAEGTWALRSGAGHQWGDGQNRGRCVPPLPAGLLIDGGIEGAAYLGGGSRESV
jgi:hypothetical protein